MNLTFFPSRSGWSAAGYFDEVAPSSVSNECVDKVVGMFLEHAKVMKVPPEVLFPDGRAAFIKNMLASTLKRPDASRRRLRPALSA